jgi:probable HAF family extracellular repeat protein
MNYCFMTIKERFIGSICRVCGRIAVVALLSCAFAGVRGSASGAVAAKVPTYTLTDLGPLPQVPDDVAMRINKAGQVSLWVPAPSFSVTAALWTGDAIKRMPSAPGYVTSLARDVNDQGQVAGWVSTSLNPVDSGATVRAVLYTHGVAKVLGTLGGRGSEAFAVDAHGRTVGVSDLADGHRHAFINDGTKMTDLGTLPNGVFSQAFSINAAGNVVGVGDSKGDHHAVEWRKGHIIDLGTLPGGGSSSAAAVNDKDQVVGFSATNGEYHAFLYSNGKMQDLGDLGDDPSSASDINNQGDVVGQSSVGNLAHHAFLWHAGKMYDLNKLMPAAAATGWTVISADAINDRGQIACVALHKDDPMQAVLLTPHVAGR